MLFFRTFRISIHIYIYRYSVAYIMHLPQKGFRPPAHASAKFSLLFCRSSRGGAGRPSRSSSDPFAWPVRFATRRTHARRVSRSESRAAAGRTDGVISFFAFISFLYFFLFFCLCVLYFPRVRYFRSIFHPPAR